LLAERERRRRKRQSQINVWRTDALALCESLGLAPDPWQREVLTSSAQTVLLNCGRQVGKTEVLATILIRALLEPESLHLILSPSERQSREVYRRVLTLWRKLGRPVRYRTVNLTSLELESGARLIALPASEHTIRGLASVRTLVIDEAGYVDDAVAQAVFPMLAVSGGRLITASTAAGKRGWWFDLINNRGDHETLYREVLSSQCPRISPEFLAREQRRIGDWWYRQEYCCCFNEAQTVAFRTEDINRAVSDDVRFDEDLFRD
jgi:hypothetical protein